MRTITVTERRARLALRHRLVPEHRASDVVEAARSLVCLHATDPATVYLSAFARVEGMQIDDLDRALYVDRSLIKHLAMRRTLFSLPRATLPFAQAGASERVATTERSRLAREVEAAGLHRNGARWLKRAEQQVFDALADGREATASELRAELPVLEGGIEYGQGKSWGGTFAIAPRVLTVLSASGRVVRDANDGGWSVSRPRWTSMDAWLGEPLAPPAEADGVAHLVRAWLYAFGPGTEADIKWWLGSTLGAVRRALGGLDVVEVDLEGATGYVLADDDAPHVPPAPWPALLPPLDPTTMGWTERAWYLGPYKAQLFDAAGNAGPTVWWDGRIVGGWKQQEDGVVVLQMLEEVGRDGRRAIEAEAERLTKFFAGRRVLPRFPSPLSRSLA